MFIGRLKEVWIRGKRVVEKGGKRGIFAKRADTLGGQMGGHFCGIEGVKNTPIRTKKVRIMTL